jgi:hypothetical protein
VDIGPYKNYKDRADNRQVADGTEQAGKSAQGEYRPNLQGSLEFQPTGDSPRFSKRAACYLNSFLVPNFQKLMHFPALHLGGRGKNFLRELGIQVPFVTMYRQFPPSQPLRGKEAQSGTRNGQVV